MERGKFPRNLGIFGLCFCVAVAALSFTRCADARSKSSMRILLKGPPAHTLIIKTTKKIQEVKRNIDMMSSPADAEPYAVISSPFSLPPYDSLAPIPLPENTPPFCIYPPFTPPQPPSTSIPTPIVGGGGGGYTPPPPPPYLYTYPSPTGSTVPSPPEYYVPSPTIINPPEIVPPPTPSTNVPPNPPNPPIYVPTPTEPALSPPFYEPSPPSYNVPPSPPNSPIYVPTPTEPALSPPYYAANPPPSGIFVPSPPRIIFQPPVVYPPPAVPPPPHTGPSIALWCVAKPSVPEPIIEEAMNYACGSGADCDSILPSGSCFEPNTMIAHASYAFNSYWQRTKVAGGTCEFGGAAMLVSVDPSNDGCHFIYY